MSEEVKKWNGLVTLSDYENLLAKYNGVFEWLGRLAICKTYIFAHSDNPRKVAEEIKKAYEESLKDV